MNREALINLRRILAQLFNDPQTIQRVVADAGIDTARVNLRGSVVDIWEAVLGEARKSDQVAALIQVASYEYPNRGAEMQQWLQALKSAPSTAPSPPVQAKNSPADNTASPPISQPATTAQTHSGQTPVQTTNAREIAIEAPRSIRLSTLERQLLGTLFARADKLQFMSEFTDGRTATRVFLIRPIDGEGRRELPAVSKVGPQQLIEEEWQAAENHLLNRLSGFAAVQGTPIYLIDPEGGENWGALRYQQVGDSLYPVTSLAQYSSDASVGDLWYVLEQRLFRQLREFWQSTQEWQPFQVQQSYDAILPVNLMLTPLAIPPAAATGALLLDGAQGISMEISARLQSNVLIQLTNFVVTELSTDRREITLDLPDSSSGTAQSFRIRVQREEADPEAAVGAVYPPLVATIRATRLDELRHRAQPQVGAAIDLQSTTVIVPDQPARTLPNPLTALPTLLAQKSEGWFATIHGDLNLRNILVEPDARTAHIIDCAKAHKGHVLHDLLRMERDIITDLLTAIFFRNRLSPTALVHFYQQLHCAVSGPPHPAGEFALPADLDSALLKPFIMIATIRRTARTFLPDQHRWESYYTGLVIHLTGALKFRDLDTPAPGHKPKALAFWGAATLLDLLQNPTHATERCQEIEWRFYDITQGDPTDVVSKGLTPDATSDDSSLGIADEPPILESATPESATTPKNADIAPVQRRLDVAAPETATLGRAFSLAVAVRQLISPPLAIETLPAEHSGQAQLLWPEEEPFVRLRVEVDAPECTIVGEAVYSFKLYRNLDSEIFYFSLIPNATGRLNIIVRLYQEADLLGSALAFTTVDKQEIGEGEVGRVQVQLHSSDPIALPQEDHQPADSTGGSGHRPIKILFLAANPLDRVFLRIDEEARAIDQALRQASNRHFEIRVHQALRVDDLQELLLRYEPNIVHFSGHGSTENELLLMDAAGKAMAVSGTALRDLFTVLKGNIRCIVLNACFSEGQAAGLAEIIDCVVGIEGLITDEASRQFSTAFYRALGYERSIGDAFRLGKVQIALAGLGEAEAFHLLTRKAGGEEVVFARTDSTNVTPTNQKQPVAQSRAPQSISSGDREFLESLLRQHRRNLQRLMQQKANFGAGEEPLRLLNQIDAEEAELARIEGELRGE